MYVSHANVKHAQTLSNEKRVLQIKHLMPHVHHI